ncbi:AbrB/MazE/SpoVT family DNA-binding domain-containing protein [Clostridium sp.]|uniref:AbrB/MazE/SpoVT family DNA-binding domain-containing protein n=1 Tax=Clostridium sp. TaxID=1506 RepID=UPI002844716C|nr:AbrB/MazE/SpoVT family DNA-binding domain-containing protein [Clostridium sp.]MDR3593813.1 AbrB/MazE/SpoVT family DNA-binding domain-containing protein [Clostridium sp.]
MKSTGVVRQVDPLGRIVIPMELRKTMNIKDGDALEIYTEGDTIILKKYVPGCSCCKEVNNDLKEVNGVRLCKKCIDKFKRV